MSQDMENKVVVIIGASSGLSEAIARHLAQAVPGSCWVPGGSTAAGIGIRTRAVLHATVQTDVTDREQVKALVDRAADLHGRLDATVNDGGLMPHSPLERGKVDDRDQMIDVNLKSVPYGMAAALPHMTWQNSGLINVSSVAGHKVRPGSSVYAATKAAVRMLSEVLSQEVKPYYIRNTATSPGAVL